MSTLWNSRGIARVRAFLLAALAITPFLHVANAQEVAESEDPPDRVARLSYRQGEVSLQTPDSTEWTAAVLNRPLTTGDKLWVDKDSRTELQVGSATIHVDEYTSLELIDLGSDDLRLGLTAGVLNVHVRDVGHDETLEIDTPNSVVSLLEPGEYHIEVNESGDTTVVKVRDGASTVAGYDRGSRTYHIDDGRQGIFTGKDQLAAAIDSIGPRSKFDDWSDDRDRRASRSESTRYVSNEVIGYEDLDEHGDWRSEAEYGYVWYPRGVATGWAPYRYGQWVWVRPWGWTWVDNSPWGFAPFHYGRWAYVGSRWGWVPGPRSIRPVYAPALVAWVGGPSVGVSVSFGSGIGWFPLGPREVYIPGYRASRRHVNNVNISNTVIVNNTYITNVYANGGRNVRYVNQGRGNGVTAVSRDDFIRGRPVDRHQIRWDDRSGGNIEANTLSPERGGGRSAPVNEVNLPGRVDNPRSATSRREVAAAEEQQRRSVRSDRPESASRESGRDNSSFRERNEVGSSPSLPAKETGRPRSYRPATSVEKRERVQTEAAPSVGNDSSNDRGNRWQTAPDANRGVGSDRRAERERATQEQPRMSGNPAREERVREAQRSRAPEAPAPQREYSPQPQRQEQQQQSQPAEREQRPTGNPASGRSRQERDSGQSQKESGRPRE